MLARRFAVALGLSVALASCSPAAGTVRLLETGSTLVYPLMNLWVAAYQGEHGDVEITTQSTGSGTGISQAIAGVAQIGASDAYMPDAAMREHPMLNVPLAISAQVIAYNLPGLGGVHLHLSGPLLAAIYGGRIAYWDDQRILAENAALRGRLPHRAIVPIRRSDGSGDTFIFTQYLSETTPWWRSGPGFGTTVSWPASGTVGANGNPGVLQTCEDAPYSIAYVGISFMDQVNGAHLGIAALRNRAGAYVLATTPAIAAAAAALVSKTPRDERISLIDAPGAGSYPIINYEYAIVNPHQPTLQIERALAGFLEWTLSTRGGQRPIFLNAVHFIALPPAVARLSRDQVARITSP
jgi:phosphate transport system substrate-binding protein